MSKNITITIESITCHRRSEFKGRKDNIYLQSGGNKLLPPGSNARNIRLGETIYPNYSCYYQPHQTVTLELWEYDAGPIKDDFLGSITFDRGSNGRHKQFMSGDGGYYEVIYSVQNPNLNIPKKVTKTPSSPPKTPSAEELYQQAKDLFDAEKWTEAIALYDRVLQLDPENLKALDSKAAALNSLKQYDEALEALEKTTKVDPDNNKAWTSKAAVLYNLERYQESIEAANKALELNLNSSLVRDNIYNQARSYALLKEDGLALVYLKIAVELDKSLKDSAKDDPALSHLYDKLDQPQASTEKQDLGHLYYELGKYQESIDAVYKAIELNLTFLPISNSVYNLGDCHASLKEDSLALANLRIAVELKETAKEWAKKENDWSHLHSDKRFKAIVGTEQT